MNQLHVVVGAGPVGSAIAAQLAASNHRVRVVTRSGGTPTDPRIERVAADASDPEALLVIAEGASVLYNAANPTDYHRWAEIWPPLAASLLSVAERSGAVLATVANLYNYGPVDGPMSEDLPDAATYTNGRVRSAMWAEAKAAHDAGRTRVVEVRASDYIGRDAVSHPGEAAKAVLAGKTARTIGDPDQPHSWTGTEDTARTLIAAAADAGAHGRTWIVPTNPPRTQRELVADLAAAAVRPPVKVAPVRKGLLRLLGLVNGPMRTMVTTYYQFDRPFIVDDRQARARFGIEPTVWTELLHQAVTPSVTETKVA